MAWRSGGREAVMSPNGLNIIGPGWRPWGFMRFEIGLRKFKPYRCHAEAIIGLGLADEAELKAIEEEGLIAEQLRDIEQLEKDAAEQ